MNSGKVLLAILALTFALTGLAVSDTQEEDFAVPAFSDLPLLGTPASTNQVLTQPMIREPLNTLPWLKRMQWLDLNHDYQLNEFDVKQFASIVEGLHGERLTGLQLTIRFRGEQKNQKESFLIPFDLDRDGMFTAYDVDYFTQLINQLDEGATRGKELVHKFQSQIFPQTTRSMK